MTDNAALAAAILALTNVIATMRQPAPAPTPVFDPFDSTKPFDLSTRAGSTAYSTISAPLDEVWDGHVATFPSFIVALRLRSEEGKWNATAPQGILTFPTGTTGVSNNILTDYHSVTDAQIETARDARTDQRAIQNAKAMFKCIKSSIKGALKDTIFTQIGNMPTHSDGNTLFKTLTSFTTVASLQLSMLSFQNILDFNPFDWEFNIPVINGKLIHLFTLATTQSRVLAKSERIQHTVNVYSKILQPEMWAQWVRNKIDFFEEGGITVCQDFMNSATMKYNKIACTTSGFKGSVHTVHDDIVAMMAKSQPSNKRKQDNEIIDITKSPPTKKVKRDTPPFMTHYKDASTGIKYKVGDTKEYGGKTFYYCDAPTHLNKIKWHTHTTDSCRVRKLWLKSKTDNDSAVANVGDAESPTPPDNDESDTNNSPSPLVALLASAMNMATDNDIVKDLIANAINATNANM